MALNSKLASIPLINSPAQLQQMMQVWRQALSRTVKVASAPPAPLNFRATSQRGGILLRWGRTNPLNKAKLLGEATTQTGPDGYEILISKSGDFVSDVTVVSINDVTQTSYFFPVSGAPTKYSFKIHSTAGTPYTPNSAFGPDSGTVQATSIDSTDTTTKPKTTYDLVTNDGTRAQARLGRYSNQYLRTYSTE